MLQLTVYPPEQQGRGAFDGGRITEFKPIGMPHDGARQKRIGPLFYWAWAHAEGYGKIGLHPHQGFEIMSYVLEGEIGHRDTLGTQSRVGKGGAQVMQTGSGVSHEEETLGEPTDFFQIWFEPFLMEAVRRRPIYSEYQDGDFPRIEEEGVVIKTILGDGSPISLVVDAAMQDVRVDPGVRYRRTLAAGRSLAVVTIEGQGTWHRGPDGETVPCRAGDLTVLHASGDGEVEVAIDSEVSLRLALVEVPTNVEYPLYPNR